MLLELCVFYTLYTKCVQELAFKINLCSCLLVSTQESEAVGVLEDALQQAWPGDITADLERNLEAAKTKLRKSRGE